MKFCCKVKISIPFSHPFRVCPQPLRAFVYLLPFLPSFGFPPVPAPVVLLGDYPTVFTCLAFSTPLVYVISVPGCLFLVLLTKSGRLYHAVSLLIPRVGFLSNSRISCMWYCFQISTIILSFLHFPKQIPFIPQIYDLAFCLPPHISPVTATLDLFSGSLLKSLRQNKYIKTTSTECNFILSQLNFVSSLGKAALRQCH